MNATAIPRNLLCAIIAPEAGGGEFISPNTSEKEDYPARIQPVNAACDEALAEGVWQLSRAPAGVSVDFPNMKGGGA